MINNNNVDDDETGGGDADNERVMKYNTQSRIHYVSLVIINIQKHVLTTSQLWWFGLLCHKRLHPHKS